MRSYFYGEKLSCYNSTESSKIFWEGCTVKSTILVTNANIFFVIIMFKISRMLFIY